MSANRDMSANRETTGSGYIRPLISAAGYKQRCRELDTLCTVARREVADRLREAAREHTGNTRLEELLEEQAQLERQIAVLAAQLAEAVVVAPRADGRAGIGSILHVRDDNGTINTYELVGPLEADAPNGWISVNAPIGDALLGHSAGARIEVATPRGPRRLTIVDVQGCSIPVTHHAAPRPHAALRPRWLDRRLTDH